ncbi:MAG: twin-arginine translocation signal domain-containing protein [Cohaesibacter sp.]|nr:twin-arginine translocation signal domain-containing protein [Cohaesibacter sp.]MCV6601772.1 twin-arginine translocation signal domain-containing protein [Cohaesibacter sp.]
MEIILSSISNETNEVDLMMDRRDFLTKSAIAAATGLMSVLPGMQRDAHAQIPRIKMRELYNKDLSFSDFAKAHEEQTILVEGFMAPPLKAESSFFVLTKRPLAVCPFCETDAEWPDDILAIYTKRILKVIPFNQKIVVKGRLALGSFKDPETGFVSRVRVVNASYERF